MLDYMYEKEGLKFLKKKGERKCNVKVNGEWKRKKIGLKKRGKRMNKVFYMIR